MDNRFVLGKLWRPGFTTGSAAAAAAKAATIALLEGRTVAEIEIKTLNGTDLTLPVEQSGVSDGVALAAIRKDSGDDPDVTDGMLIVAQVKKGNGGIEIRGGEGVGRVTKPGLDQPVGAPAINTGPRQSIRDACLEASRSRGYQGGLEILISLPGGEKIAKKTFNPKLGIVGGLSILGTTGIVEPMSQKALIDTIRAEIRVLGAEGKSTLLLSPGNYGRNFAKDILGLTLHAHIKCSNFIGDALAEAIQCGFAEVLLIGHIGKMVKLGIGLTNTHSAEADGRLETLIACALEAGAPLSLLKDIQTAVTTDAALDCLERESMLTETMAILLRRIEETLLTRVADHVEVGFIVFRGVAESARECLRNNAATRIMEKFRV